MRRGRRRRAGGNRGANLDVIFPRQVSVWVGASTVDSHGLPLSGRSLIVGDGPFSVLHLDSVKRWGCDGPGFEPHRGDTGVVDRAAKTRALYRVMKGDVRADGGQAGGRAGEEKREEVGCRVRPERGWVRRVERREFVSCWLGCQELVSR